MWRIWIVAAMWGLNWPAVKILLTAISPWTLRGVGLGLGAATLVLITLAMGRSLRIAPRDRINVVIGGLLTIAAFNLCTTFAQLIMPASRAAILTFTMPFFTAVFSYFVLGERVDALRAVSLVLGAAGIAILAAPFLPVIVAGDIPIGLVYVLGAAMFWAAGTVYLKRFPITADSLAVSTWQLVVGAVTCAAGALIFETPRFDVVEPRVIAAFAFHVLLPQSIAYALWFTMIKTVSASTATLGTLLIPVFGVAGSMLVLGEQPAATDFIGFGLMLAAVLLDQVVRAVIAPPKPTAQA